MASLFTPTDFTVAIGPYAIDVNDCIGDSVGILNANTNYLAAGVKAVSATNDNQALQITSLSSQFVQQSIRVGAVVQTALSSSSTTQAVLNVNTPGSLNVTPTTSHGVEAITGAITPVYSNSKVVGEVSIPFDLSNGKPIILAFFRNTETNAFAAQWVFVNNNLSTLNASFIDTVTSTSQIVYKVRICNGSSSTDMYINRDSSGNTVNGLLKTVFTLQEIKA